MILVAATLPIPADPPIDGPFWTYVLPAALFLVAFLATWGLYRRFSRERP
jgi:hypothetical protein